MENSNSIYPLEIARNLLFFIAAILFVLLYRSIGKFSVGPKGVEFEMSTEHRQFSAKAQVEDAISRIER